MGQVVWWLTTHCKEQTMVFDLIYECKTNHFSPMLAWLESMTRLNSRFLVTRTRLQSRWERWWLDSSHVYHRM